MTAKDSEAVQNNGLIKLKAKSQVRGQSVGKPFINPETTNKSRWARAKFMIPGNYLDKKQETTQGKKD